MPWNLNDFLKLLLFGFLGFLIGILALLIYLAIDIDLKNILDILLLIISLLAIILGGLWGYFKWQNEQKTMRKEEGQYDPRLNMFIQIKKHKGRSDETNLIEIRGLLKNIGRIPIQLNYSKSKINIYKIPEDYKDSIETAFLKPHKIINFTKTIFSDLTILDTGITYPTPTTIYDIPKKGTFYFEIIFDIGNHKDTFSHKEVLSSDTEELPSLIYYITLLLTAEDSEVSHSSLE